MPKVTALPEGQTSGDLMTQFTELAEKKSKSWTFEDGQNHFFARNEGAINLEFKVADKTIQLRPGETFGEPVDFTSFAVKTVTDDADATGAYRIAATRYGFPGMDKLKHIDTAKPAQDIPVEDDQNVDKK